MHASGLAFIIDDDAAARNSLRDALERKGIRAFGYGSSSAFLAHYLRGVGGCVIAELGLADMPGLELQRILKAEQDILPFIFVAHEATVRDSVRAVQNGALDVLEKPYDLDRLLGVVREALLKSRRNLQRYESARQFSARVTELSARETSVFDLWLCGLSTKEIGLKLGLSPRTVEVHRGNLRRKLGVRDFPSLVRLAINAGVMAPEAAAESPAAALDNGTP